MLHNDGVRGIYLNACLKSGVNLLYIFLDSMISRIDEYYVLLRFYIRHTGPKFVMERVSGLSVIYQKDEIYFVVEIISFV